MRRSGSNAFSRAACQPCLISVNGFRVVGLGSTKGQPGNRGTRPNRSMADCDNGTWRGFPVLLVGISQALRSKSMCRHSALSSSETRAPVSSSRPTMYGSCVLRV